MTVRSYLIVNGDVPVDRLRTGPTDDRSADENAVANLIDYSAHHGGRHLLVYLHPQTGVAVPLAAANPVAGMILESPFTSAADVAAVRYWFVPVRLLMKDQFRSDLQIGKVTAPVLVLHGDRDDIVPIALGERLYAMINAPKRFVRLAGGGHNDLGARAIEAAQRFLGERLR